jgi:prolyl-tRNA editing enzyme YbaK/EbsC (Cys-tRNA(Pro) deacylase)
MIVAGGSSFSGESFWQGMHETASEFVELARERYDFAVELSEFPEGTKTAQDAADAIGCDVRQIVKSIVLSAELGSDAESGAEEVEGAEKAEDDVIVVLTAGHHHVDTDELAARLDARAVATADPETVKRRTGWSIGGVPPFCHDNEIPVYLDESLTDHETIWAAAGTPESVFPISPEALLRIADPTPVEAFVDA